MQNGNIIFPRQCNYDKLFFLVHTYFGHLIKKLLLRDLNRIIETPNWDIFVLAGWCHYPFHGRHLYCNNFSWVTFEGLNKLPLLGWPYFNCSVSRPSHNVVAVMTKLKARYKIAVTFEYKLVSHRFNIPDFQRALHHWGNHVGLATEGNGAFLG